MFSSDNQTDVIEQVTSNKSSLLLKIILQNSQTLHLFTKIIKTEISLKVIKMINLKA